MCGICGELNHTGELVAPALLRKMAGMLRHRGPDDTGVYCDSAVGLGHARLSIIDISGGRQPMCAPDHSVAITFNGEIFNYIELRDELLRKGHRFVTSSDTEVILHLYQEEGEQCVERLNGQWAFAIWEARRRRLFLSRDRFGVRPLFYTQAAGKFFFASEIKALLACPEVDWELDLEALDQVFTFWFVLPPRTAFRNIWQLPPGHSLIIEDGSLRVTRYWHFNFPDDGDYLVGSEEELSGELLGLLLDATRLRSRADVPVGAYLSGGLDSTFVAALAKKTLADRLRTFSVSFVDPEFDESTHQEAAIAFLGTHHSSVRCSSADILRVFPEVVWHAEQPILRTAPAPLFLLSSLVRSSGYKVALTGEGADEILGGYDIFKEVKIRSFWARNPGSSMRPKLLKRLYPYMQGIRRQPHAYLERFFSVGPRDLGNPFFSHLPRWNLTARLKQFFSEAVRQALRPDAALSELHHAMPLSFASWPWFHRAEYLEFMYLLPGYILSSQGDRMALAHSVECRYPFLDHRIVEFASKLHPNLKMKVLDEKHLLKRAAQGWIPDSIRQRHKQPYRAPSGIDLAGPGAEYVKEMLSVGRIRRDGIFDSGSVESLLRKFQSGSAIGARDNMALVGILSTAILLERMQKERARARDPVAPAGSLPAT